jgi:hypothetical protein
MNAVIEITHTWCERHLPEARPQSPSLARHARSPARQQQVESSGEVES